MRYALALVTGMLAVISCSPTSYRHELHERRHAPPRGWRKHSGIDRNMVVPMKVALKQPNIEDIEFYLLDVSHPDSENFGQHWSAQEVAEKFAPSRESVEAVIDWLIDSGIHSGRIEQSQSLGWINFDATIEEAERLLKTEYHIYEHTSGKPHVACSEYSLPEAIRSHIDFVTPTVHFDAKLGIEPTEMKRRKRDIEPDCLERRGLESAVPGVNPTLVPGANSTASHGGSSTAAVGSSTAAASNSTAAAGNSTAAAGRAVQTDRAKKVGSPDDASVPKAAGKAHPKNPADLSGCSSQTTPACLQALYNFNASSNAAPGNTFGVVEYTPQAYLASDLDLFFQSYASSLVGQRPILDSVDGGVIQNTSQSFAYNGESNLDLQYAMALSYPQQVTLYQVGDIVQGASFNNFLDAIDKTYCTYMGGDDITQDAVYPDTIAGGYTGPKNCGGFAATKVISTSYSYNEADLTPFYEKRQCNEYAKLGLQGVSVLYSSGDFGVGGNYGQCIDPTTGNYNDGSSGLFNPSFPSTCPFVTSVGATQMASGSTVKDTEQACTSIIYSGGGFSNVFAMPAYQSKLVKAWWKSSAPVFNPARYNTTMTSRGYPDVSANGANYVVAVNGGFSLVFGTSASAPVFASIVTYINQARLLQNKNTVGFLNPTLYANPHAFKDVTVGTNPGCGTSGFSATTGWDPVTGLGTPKAQSLLDAFLQLP